MGVIRIHMAILYRYHNGYYKGIMIQGPVTLRTWFVLYGARLRSWQLG